MQFKKPTDKDDFDSGAIRPRLHALLLAIDEFCVYHELPEVVVTSLCSLNDKHEKDSQHYHGEAADIRAHHLTAPQLALILNYAHEHYWRSEKNIVDRPMRAAYAYGEGDAFHIHLSIDKQRS